MSDENQKPGPQEPTNPDDGKKPDTNEPPEAIPYGRFKEVNEERQELKSRLEKLEQEREQQRKKELEEKEEFKSLYQQEQEKREAAEQKAQQWQEYQDNKRATLLEALPEDDQEIYSDLSLEKLEKHVNNQQAKPPETNNDSSMLLRKFGFKTLKEASRAAFNGDITHEQYKDIRRGFQQQT